MGHSNIQGLDREALKVLQELCAKGEERLKSMVATTSTRGWVGVGDIQCHKPAILRMIDTIHLG